MEMMPDSPRVADYVRALGRRKWLIVGGMLVCMAAAAVVSLVLPELYEAKTSLLVMPAPFKPDLTPSALSVYAYESLARADDLKQAIIDTLELVEPGTTDPMRLARLDAMMETKVVKETIVTPNAREQMVPSSPVITFQIRCRRREGPTRIVNTWAEFFVARNSGLSAREMAGSYRFIMDQYAEAKRNLEQAEDSLDAFDRRSDLTLMRKELDAATAKLGEYETIHLSQQLELSTKESEYTQLSRQLNVLQGDGGWIGSVDTGEGEGAQLGRGPGYTRGIRETVLAARSVLLTAERRLLAFRDRYHIELLKASLGQRRSSLVEYTRELADIEILMASTDQALSRVKPLQIGGATMPVVSDAFDANTLREIWSLGAGYNFFQPRKRYLLLEMARGRAEVDSLERHYNRIEWELEHLTRDATLARTAYDALSRNYAGLVERVNGLQVEIDVLRPRMEHSERLLEDLRREVSRIEKNVSYTEVERARLQRDVSKYESTFERFASLAEDARIAKAETSGDVKIVAAAHGPGTFVSPKIGQNVIIAGLVGLMISMVLALLLEYMVKPEA